MMRRWPMRRSRWPLTRRITMASSSIWLKTTPGMRALRSTSQSSNLLRRKPDGSESGRERYRHPPRLPWPRSRTRAQASRGSTRDRQSCLRLCTMTPPRLTSPGSLSISIVIITYRRLSELSQCLTSVLGADLPSDAEIVVVCNGREPATSELLESFAARDARLNIVEIQRTSPAAARNSALARATGEIVYFLDDDVTVVPDLFSRALMTFATRPDAMVVGGPNLTPPDSATFQHCVGEVFSSWFGAATVRDRFCRRGGMRPADDSALILCNLALRRPLVSELPEPFKEHLVCNEENVLLGELGASGARMLHDPDLIVYHRRRSNLREFAAQVFRYGRGRWQNTLVAPSSLSLAYITPAIFLLYLVSMLLVQ